MWGILRRTALRSRNSLSLSSFNPSPFTTNRRWLTTDEYHGIADETLEAITESYEKLIETQPDVDVDLSQGVLTLTMPVGTYVINKQPPNHQIWLSSPVSGPKRYDWDEKNKKWVYPRESTSLGELLKMETKEALELNLNLDVD